LQIKTILPVADPVPTSSWAWIAWFNGSRAAIIGFIFSCFSRL